MNRDGQGKHRKLTASITFLIHLVPEAEHIDVRIAEEILHFFRVAVELLVFVDSLELSSK